VDGGVYVSDGGVVLWSRANAVRVVCTLVDRPKGKIVASSNAGRMQARVKLGLRQCDDSLRLFLCLVMFSYACF
jgi:hypothetical protein